MKVPELILFWAWVLPILLSSAFAIQTPLDNDALAHRTPLTSLQKRGTVDVTLIIRDNIIKRMSRKARRIIQRGKLNNIVSIRDVEVGPILDLPDLLGKGLSADIKELTVPLINVTNVDLTLDEGRLGISAEGVNIKATVRVALKHLGSGITIEPLIVVTARGNAQGSLLTASTPSPPTTPHPQVQTHNLSLHLTHFDFSLPNLSTIPRFMFDAIEFLVRASIRRQIEWAVSTKISDFLTSYLNKTFEKEVAVNGVADTRNQYVSMGFDVGYNVKMQFVGPLRFTKEGIVTGVRTKPTVKAVPA